MGLHIYYSGRREGWRRKGGTKRGGAGYPELPEEHQVISCCVTNQVPGDGREMEGGGSIRKGLDGGRDRTVGFRILLRAQKQIGVNRAAPLLENTTIDLRSDMRSRAQVAASLAAVSLSRET